MAKSGGKVAKSGEKWGKVGLSGERWGKVGKSGFFHYVLSMAMPKYEVER